MNGKVHEWMLKVFICSEDEELEPRATLGKITDVGLLGCCISKLDDYLVIISERGDSSKSVEFS